MTECPICRSRESRFFFRKNDQNLLICRRCRHVWWEITPSEEDLARYYEQTYTGNHNQDRIQEEARDYYRSHLKELLRVAAKTAENASLMDYGCSIPVLVSEAVAMGFRSAVGVDFASAAREWGRQNGAIVLMPDELRDTPDGSVDIIRFSHALEHSRSPLDVLGVVARKLRPGGLLYITQPSFPIFRFQESLRDLKDTVYPEHLHFFSPLSLTTMVRRAGLSVIQFFTHQNEGAVCAAHSDMIDDSYSRESMKAFAAKGDAAYPALANYPAYAGENSVLYAIRPKSFALLDRIQRLWRGISRQV